MWYESCASSLIKVAFGRSASSPAKWPEFGRLMSLTGTRHNWSSQIFGLAVCAELSAETAERCVGDLLTILKLEIAGLA